MLDALNVIFIAANIAAQTLNVVARADEDILIQKDVKVYAVSMTEQAPMWTDKCKYQGVMVEYARDWEEEQLSTGIILPAEPDKPIGYALILTKERCPEKEERQIFNVGESPSSPFFGRKHVLREGNPVDTRDFVSMKEEFRPKWMPQVLRTIEAEAPKNPAAHHFLDEIRSRTAAADAITPQQIEIKAEEAQPADTVPTQELQPDPTQADNEQADRGAMN